jgi:hypothetical protein
MKLEKILDRLGSTLSHIYDAFKESKHKEFPYVLFRDIVINRERIIKALSK